MRFLVRDDQGQAAAAKEVIEAWSPVAPGFIGTVVAAELYLVLTRSYGYAVQEVAGALSRLLAMPQVRFEDPALVREAVSAVARGADFADALIAGSAAAASCSSTVTFDRGAARSAGMTLLN